MIPGRLVRRYKRFLADIELDSGELITAHCANPGSMKNCLAADARVWVSRSNNPKRKLAYTWELVKIGRAMINVNTHRANDIVEVGLRDGTIAELSDFATLKREVKYGERSRVDFLLTIDDVLTYLEVKSATMGIGAGVTAFPDSVTARGKRHLEELMAMVDQGHRAVLLFCASRSDTKRVRPADDIDPAYGETLRQAADHGVELLAYRCSVSARDVKLQERVPVDLSR